MSSSSSSKKHSESPISPIIACLSLAAVAISAIWWRKQADGPAETTTSVKKERINRSEAELNDVKFMRLAIEEAKKCVPVETAYNVGCVITHGENVLSKGFSREIAGNTHAEQNALTKLEEMQLRDDTRDLTLYTTMEPCSRRLSENKPCCERCIENKRIRRVVIGVMEPLNFVKCKGVQRMKDAGIQVTLLKGLEDDCLSMNSHFEIEM